MRNWIIVCILMFAFWNESKSEIMWADTVLGCTSDISTRYNVKNQYTAHQALGKPSITSDFGESPCAWMPESNMKRIEWIKLGFKSPKLAKRVFIHENVNPGAIIKVYIYDSLNKEHLIYGNSKIEIGAKEGRIFTIDLDSNSNYTVSAIKIELSLENYIDVYQIDAVGVSDKKEDYKVNINTFGENVKYYVPENLGKSVNSLYSDLGPVISPDGKELFFTRDGHPKNTGKKRQQDIWYSKFVDSINQFSNAINLGAPLNTEGNNFVLSVTPDGNSLLIGNVYNEDGTFSNGLSVSYRNGEQWSFPKGLKIDNFYNHSSTGSYSLGANGKFILLSVLRDDSFGGRDLYVSHLKPDGSWAEPMNLGSTINSSADEDSPFMASDGLTLYYSSSGKPGYGSNDMFMSVRLDSTWSNWSEPINMGKGINTKGWDGFYTIPASGEFAYFVSSENSIGNDDIFRVKLPEELKPKKIVLISGKVLDSKTNKPVSAMILYETLPDGKNIGNARSNPETGEYKIALPEGYKYGFLAQADNYIAVNENVDLTNLKEYKEVEKNLILVPIEKGQVIRINNIFFKYNDFNLLPDSFIELNRLVEFMVKNPNIRIQINGHTDDIGSNESNRVLSTKRANSVVEYLISKGIEKNRMRSVGWGEEKPIADNSIEEGRQQNRRVEFVIINK